MLSEFLPAWRRIALLLLFAAAVAIAGCGGSDDSSDETTTDAAATTSTETTTETEGQQQGQAQVKPLAPPKPKESIEEAAKRITKTMASGDCDRIAKLLPVTRQPAPKDFEARCDQLQTRFENTETGDTETFAHVGGVIDYTSSTGVFSAVLVVDQDGLFHIALIDPFLREKSVGTKEAKQFDNAADSAVKALRDRDCDAVLAVANRRLGPGALDESAACDYVENNQIAAVFDANPQAKLKSFGGNADYALYGVAGPNVFYVLLMARESDENLPEAGEPLPNDAPEYGFAGVLRTNLKKG